MASTRDKINNQRFSIRFCHVAKDLGFTTVSQMKRFIDKCEPELRVGNTRAWKLEEEVNDYLNTKS